MKELSVRLKKAMRMRNISQLKLAELAGCSQSAITKLLHGESKGSRFMIDIAAALKVDALWLQKGVGSIPENTSKIPVIKMHTLVLLKEQGKDPSLLMEDIYNRSNEYISWANIQLKDVVAIQVTAEHLKDNLDNISYNIYRTIFSIDDWLIVHPFKKPKNDNFVIVYDPIEWKGQGPTIFRYVNDCGLESFLDANPSHNHQRVRSKNAIILGVVMTKIKDLS